MIPPREDPWVLVAVALRPHGLRGALLLKPMTRSPEEFLDAPLTRLVPRLRGKLLDPVRIEHCQAHKGAIMAQFAGFASREDADTLRGAEFLIPEEERWELPPGTWYHDQLTDLELVDANDGTPIGPVLRVTEGVAHDFLVFANPKNPGKEVLLPAKEPFLVEVDLEGGRARVAIPEGLLDL